MSYEASAHEAQMKILRHLLLAPHAGFSVLQKTTDLSSDHFNFHIKKLLDVGYIEKAGDKYTLSRAGKEYANRMDTDENVIEKQPKLSVVLVIENDRGEFLAQQRLKQPYYGFWGLPTGKIRWSETTIDAAARELAEETGLRAKLRVSGMYHKMDYEKDSGEFLEDKYFVVVHGTEPTGELINDDEGHHNEWTTVERFEAHEKKYASMPDVVELARRDGMEFLEEKHTYGQDEY